MAMQLPVEAETSGVRSSTHVGARRWKHGLAVAASAGLLAVGTAGPAVAAPGLEDTGDTIANVVVQSAIALTALTPSFTLTGIPGATVEGINAVTMVVETNNLAGYEVSVESTTPELAPIALGNTDAIPIELLSVRESGTADYTPLSDTVPVIVHTQDGRSAEGGDAVSNDYSVDIPFVNEDTYTTTLTYVATTL